MAWGLVEDGSVTTVYNYAQSITIGTIKHPKEIFTLWSDSERADLGIYPVTAGTKKDRAYYTNGNPSYTWDASSSKVVESFSPTARTLTTVKVEKIEDLKNQASDLIRQYGWLVERKIFADVTIPSDVTTYVASVISAVTTAITNVGNASDVDAVASAVLGVSYPDDSGIITYRRTIR